MRIDLNRIKLLKGTDAHDEPIRNTIAITLQNKTSILGFLKSNYTMEEEGSLWYNADNV